MVIVSCPHSSLPASQSITVPSARFQPQLPPRCGSSHLLTTVDDGLGEHSSMDGTRRGRLVAVKGRPPKPPSRRSRLFSSAPSFAQANARSIVHQLEIFSRKRDAGRQFPGRYPWSSLVKPLSEHTLQKSEQKRRGRLKTNCQSENAVCW